MNSIEIAIKMEKDAIVFYNEAAGKTSNAVGKKMFLTIAGDEKRHLDMLSQILKGLEISAGDVSPMEQIQTIFEKMKDEMLENVKATTDELYAFKIAMEMEKEGKVFYEKALQSAVTVKEKALFELLVKEEQQHYDIFSNTHSFLSDTGNWFMWDEHSIVEG